MRKWVKRVVLFFLGVYLILAAGLYFFQESMLFLPSHLDQEYEYGFANAAEEINLESEGVTLNGLHFKVKNSKGVILYFHGNAGDLSRWGEIVQPLLKFTHDIVIMDYRGYGKNGGELSEVVMHADAQVFYDYTKQQYAESEIVVYGRSLGTAFATVLASENNPSKLILETPFYSIAAVAKQRFPFLPIDWLLKYRFETYKRAPQVNCPVLVLLSGKDNVVPYESGLKLAQEFNKVKTVSIVEAGHNNQAQFEEYWTELADFLKD